MDNNFLEYCINQGLFTNEQLRGVISQMTPSESIYEKLTSLKIIEETQLAVSAGEYYDCPVVDIMRVTPDPKATAYGAALECRKYAFLPFALDPVVGVLVALADYSMLGSIRSFLKAAHVERMKFYIAPCQALNQMLDTIYGQQAAAPEPEVKRMRKQSILRTQSVDFDLGARRVDSGAGFNPASSSLPTSDSRRLQAMAFELAACREENSTLRHRIEQLSTAVELESGMIRELAKVLKTSGALDAASFERWLSAMR